MWMSWPQTWSWTKQSTSEHVKKRLSQKSRKLQSYVWSRLRKNVPKSSKVHRVIKNVATRRKSRHKTSVRLVQKMRRKPIFRTRKVNSTMRYVNKSNTARHGKKYFKHLTFLCNFLYNEFKSLTDRGDFTKYKLCNDVDLVLFCTMLTQ